MFEPCCDTPAEPFVPCPSALSREVCSLSPRQRSRAVMNLLRVKQTGSRSDLGTWLDNRNFRAFLPLQLPPLGQCGLWTPGGWANHSPWLPDFHVQMGWGLGAPSTSGRESSRDADPAPAAEVASATKPGLQERLSRPIPTFFMNIN